MLGSRYYRARLHITPPQALRYHLLPPCCRITLMDRMSLNSIAYYHRNNVTVGTVSSTSPDLQRGRSCKALRKRIKPTFRRHYISLQRVLLIYHRFAILQRLLTSITLHPD